MYLNTPLCEGIFEMYYNWNISELE